MGINNDLVRNYGNAEGYLRDVNVPIEDRLVAMMQGAVNANEALRQENRAISAEIRQIKIDRKRESVTDTAQKTIKAYEDALKKYEKDHCVDLAIGGSMALCGFGIGAAMAPVAPIAAALLIPAGLAVMIKKIPEKNDYDSPEIDLHKWVLERFPEATKSEEINRSARQIQLRHNTNCRLVDLQHENLISNKNENGSEDLTNDEWQQNYALLRKIAEEKQQLAVVMDQECIQLRAHIENTFYN